MRNATQLTFQNFIKFANFYKCKNSSIRQLFKKMIYIKNNIFNVNFMMFFFYAKIKKNSRLINAISCKTMLKIACNFACNFLII